MIALAHEFYRYDVVYFTRGEMTPHKSHVIQHLMARLDFLKSTQGHKRDGPKISWDISINLRHLRDSKELDARLNSDHPPAVIIFDDSVVEEEVENYKQRTKNKNVFVIKVTPNPTTQPMHGNLDEIAPEVLASREHFDKKKLNDSIAMGVMYHHYYKHEKDQDHGVA